MDQLKAWLLERFQPVVLVAASPAAENICLQASGLTVVDLLRPTCTVNQLSVPLRVGEFSTRIQEISLRFHAHNTIFQPKPEVIDEQLRAHLSTSAQQQVKLEVIPNLLQRVQTEAPEALTPWYYAYRDEFMRLLRFSDHEILDQPLAGVLVVPADAPSAVQHMEALLAGLTPPPAVAAGLMAPLADAAFPKHYVLLLDAAGGMDEQKAAQNLAQLQARFGRNCCSMLKIRSNAAAPPGAPPEMYRRARPPCVPGGGAGEPEQRPPEPPEGLGHGISADDLAAVGTVLREFCTGTLLPRMEERITRLNITIAATRKGLKNRLSRLWKGAAADGATPQSEAPFPYTTVESQMRQLADLAFLLRQYEFAMGMYRLAAQDYQAVNNNRWYAGVEEMLGLCYILAPDPATDPLKYFNRAMESYPRAAAAGAGGRTGRMLATRCAMTAAAYHAAGGRHHHAGMVLMAAHFEEEPSRAALLLEGAAWCQLRGVPPQARRAAFQLVLAGLRYNNAKQRRLAIHCYLQVGSAYAPSAWRAIREHLADILGKQCLELGDTPGALRHTGQLLLLAAQAGRSAAVQAQHWEQYKGLMKRVAAQQGGSAAASPLQLPQLQADTVDVSFSDQRLAGDAVAAGSVPQSAWLKMEALLAGGDMSSSNWLEGFKQVKDGEEYNVVAAKEAVGFTITFTNPTQLKLKLTEVQLTCEFQPAVAAAPGSSTGVGVGAEGGALPKVLGPAAYQTAAAAPAVAPQAEQVLIHPATLTLHPGEVLHETLTLVPSAPGWLRVTGVTWVTDGVVPGRAVFDIRGRHRKKPKGDRPSQRKHYPPQRRLLLQVLPPQPRLEVSWEALPASLYHGELLRVPLVLTNKGHAAAAALKVAISNPYVAVGAAQRISSRSSGTGGAEALRDVLPPGWLDTWPSLAAGGDHLSPSSSHHQRHKSGPAALGAHPGDLPRSSSPTGHGRSKSSVPAGALSHHAASTNTLAALGGSGSGSGGGGGHNSSSTGGPGSGPAGPGASSSTQLVTNHVFQLSPHHHARGSRPPAAGGDSGPLVLQPEERVVVPLWLHAASADPLEFNCVWYCEPQVVTSSVMRYRVLRCAPRLPVAPLLGLGVGVSPCPTHLASYLLRLDASGGQAAPPVTLTQLSCITPHNTPATSTSSASEAAAVGSSWQVAPVGADASAPAAVSSSSWSRDAAMELRLAPGDSSAQYLQLQCRAGCGSPPAAAAAAAAGGGAGLLCLASGPAAYFLHQGQQQQPGRQQAVPPAAGAAAAAGGSAGAGVVPETHASGVATAVPAAAAAAGAVSEPTLDVVVMWCAEGPPTPTAAAAAGDEPGALMSSSSSSRPLRCGMLVQYDVCAAQRLNPVRMLLAGPPQGQVTHDFRAASLCVVPLSLQLRNAGPSPVALALRAGPGAAAQDTQHAWFTSRAAPKGQQRGGAAGGQSVEGRSPRDAGGPGGGGPEGGVRAGGAGGPSSGVGSPGAGPGGEAGGVAPPPLQSGLPPSTPHVWCGVTEAELLVGPGGKEEVGLQVAVFRPGVYVVEDYMLQWHYVGGGGAPGTGPAPRLGGNKMGAPLVLKVSAAGATA